MWKDALQLIAFSCIHNILVILIDCYCDTVSLREKGKMTNGRAPDPQISSEQACGEMLITHTYSDDDNNNNNNNNENNNNEKNDNENNDKWQTT